jgi:alpha-L-fucosidase
VKNLTPWILGLALGCASSGNPVAPEPTPTEPARTSGAAGDDPGAQAVPVAPDTPIQDRPDMEWWRQSMKDRAERVAWFKQARFGMFVHWGAYSHLGGVWNGKKVEGYAEHIMRKEKITSAVYQEKLAAPFNPTEFNADEWMANAKKAGMGYFVITSKHHDGFAMYDSQVSDYNVVKVSAWHHDPMKDLKAAAQKHGIKFGFYYSQAWEWHHPDSPGNDWERDNPGGDRRLFGQRYWETNPELVTKVRRYVDGKVIPQLKELIAKYDPDIIWFDTPGRLPPEENLRVLKAVREAKPTLVVNSRICQPVPNGPPANFGDYFSTTDKPAEFPPPPGDGTGEWEGIPTTNESYGWHKMDTTHKPPSHFVQLLAKAAARGGNLLLNIGPMANGKFEQKDVDILGGVGAWMKVNGESITGTDRTPLPVQAWGESTRKGNTLYLHVLNWPRKGRVVVGGLKSDVKRAYLLSAPKRKLEVRRLGPVDVAVQAPAKAPDAVDTVIALELAGEPATDPTRLLSSDVAADTLRAFDGKLEGELTFAQGKAENSYVQGWKRAGDRVVWSVRLREPASFDVAVSYNAPKASAGGTFVVKVADKSLAGQVAETPSAPVSLGRVSLPAGNFDIVVEGTAIKGEELMRLRALTLTPATGAMSLR